MIFVNVNRTKQQRSLRPYREPLDSVEVHRMTIGDAA